jgi:hypothetical protein
MEKCKPWDHVGPGMLDISAMGSPPEAWTAEKMKNFAPDALYEVMRQNNGGIYEARARAEIARRQNEQLSCLINQVGEQVEILAKSSGRLERLTVWLNVLTVALIILAAVAAVPVVEDLVRTIAARY